MSNNTPAPPPDDSLTGPDRMLDAINNLQTGGQPHTGVLRTMFAIPEAKTIESTETKLRQTLPRPSAKSGPPGPAL